MRSFTLATALVLFSSWALAQNNPSAQHPPDKSEAATSDQSGHTVEGWIRKGLLKAKRSEVLNGPRFPWVIRERDVLAFIFEHPCEFVLRKVDQTWFLDLMAEHARACVAAALEAQHARSGRRPAKRAPRSDERETAWLA